MRQLFKKRFVTLSPRTSTRNNVRTLVSTLLRPLVAATLLLFAQIVLVSAAAVAPAVASGSSIWTPTARHNDSSTARGFCAKYGCACVELAAPRLEVQCALRDDTTAVDFLDPGVLRVDLSGSRALRFVSFGDVTLSVQSLSLARTGLRKIHEGAFNRMPHLRALDLADNRLAAFEDIALANLNRLERLNLSSAFVSEYALSRELCALVSLRSLDLGALDLREFALDCWQQRANTPLEELRARHARNLERSWPRWFAFVGDQLRLLDLTGTDLVQLDAAAHWQLANLHTLVLDHNERLDLPLLLQLLQSSSSSSNTNRAQPLVARLRHLSIANVGADNDSLPLRDLFEIGSPLSSLSSTSLTTFDLAYLDISGNRFAGDLGELVLARRRLANLSVLIANNNRLTSCGGSGSDSRRVMTKASASPLPLEHVDLSYNQLEGDSCLRALHTVRTLRHVDLSHNRLATASSVSSVLFRNNNYNTNGNKKNNNNNSSSRFGGDSADLFTDGLFGDALDLQWLDLSFNQLRTVQLAATATRVMRLLDLSSNSLRLFAIVTSQQQQPQQPPRFLHIDTLNLSRNVFNAVDVDAMLRAVSSVSRLDLSRNPLQRLTGLDSSSSSSVCVGDLELNDCLLSQVPTLGDACVRRVHLRHNLLRGRVSLLVSALGSRALDLLDLQSNNISSLAIVVQEATDSSISNSVEGVDGEDSDDSDESNAPSRGRTAASAAKFVTPAPASFATHLLQVNMNENWPLRCADHCHLDARTTARLTAVRTLPQVASHCGLTACSRAGAIVVTQMRSDADADDAAVGVRRVNSHHVQFAVSASLIVFFAVFLASSCALAVVFARCSADTAYAPHPTSALCAAWLRHLCTAVFDAVSPSDSRVAAAAAASTAAAVAAAAVVGHGSGGVAPAATPRRKLRVYYSKLAEQPDDNHLFSVS